MEDDRGIMQMLPQRSLTQGANEVTERIARCSWPGINCYYNPLACKHGGLPRFYAHSRNLLLGGHKDVSIGFLDRIGQEHPAILSPLSLHWKKALAKNDIKKVQKIGKSFLWFTYADYFSSGLGLLRFGGFFHNGFVPSNKTIIRQQKDNKNAVLGIVLASTYYLQ